MKKDNIFKNGAMSIEHILLIFGLMILAMDVFSWAGTTTEIAMGDYPSNNVLIKKAEENLNNVTLFAVPTASSSEKTDDLGTYSSLDNPSLNLYSQKISSEIIEDADEFGLIWSSTKVLSSGQLHLQISQSSFEKVLIKNECTSSIFSPKKQGDGTYQGKKKITLTEKNISDTYSFLFYVKIDDFYLFTDSYTTTFVKELQYVAVDKLNPNNSVAAKLLEIYISPNMKKYN